MTTAPFALGTLDHLVLRVRDVEGMTAFYRDVLGCTEERALPDLGLFQLRAGAALIDLVAVDSPLGSKGGAAPGSEAHNVDHFCLRVDPFDEAEISAWLAAADVTAEPAARRYGADGFGLSIYLQDPEGNTVELKGPPER